MLKHLQSKQCCRHFSLHGMMTLDESQCRAPGPESFVHESTNCSKYLSSLFLMIDLFRRRCLKTSGRQRIMKPDTDAFHRNVHVTTAKLRKLRHRLKKITWLSSAGRCKFLFVFCWVHYSKTLEQRLPQQACVLERLSFKYRTSLPICCFGWVSNSHSIFFFFIFQLLRTTRPLQNTARMTVR